MKFQNVVLAVTLFAAPLLILPACQSVNKSPTAAAVQIPTPTPLTLPLAWNWDVAPTPGATGANYDAAATWFTSGFSTGVTTAPSTKAAVAAKGYSASASCYGGPVDFVNVGQYGLYSFTFPGAVNLSNASTLSMAVSIAKAMAGTGGSSFIQLNLMSGNNSLQSKVIPNPTPGAWVTYGMPISSYAPNNLASVQQISLQFGDGPVSGTGPVTQPTPASTPVTLNAFPITTKIYIDAVTIQ